MAGYAPSVQDPHPFSNHRITRQVEGISVVRPNSSRRWIHAFDSIPAFQTSGNRAFPSHLRLQVISPDRGSQFLPQDGWSNQSSVPPCLHETDHSSAF